MNNTINTVSKRKAKQAGFVMTTELVLLVTIMVVGLTVGLVNMRDAVTGEMEDVAEAIGQLDQSYAFNGLVNSQNTGIVEGSSYGDAVDTNAGDNVEFNYIAVDGVEGATYVSPNLGSSSASALGTVR